MTSLLPHEAPDILHRFVTQNLSSEARLEYGRIRRDEMFQAIERGEKPKTYAAEWIRESSLAVLALLGNCAQKFNSEHPADQASALDLMDVLSTAMGLLKRGASKVK